MRVKPTSRHRTLRVLGLVVLVGWAAGCGEGATAPSARSAAPVAQVAVAQIVAVQGDTVVSQFVIRPRQGGRYSIGMGHLLVVRADGVCDLASPYGPAYWDQPCELETAPVEVVARSWVDGLGHPHVQLSPDLRFVPDDASDPKHASAVLYMWDRTAMDSSAKILYCGPDGCIDEARDDASLATYRAGASGILYRRIKHFSGYEVSIGRSDLSE